MIYEHIASSWISCQYVNDKCSTITTHMTSWSNSSTETNSYWTIWPTLVTTTKIILIWWISMIAWIFLQSQIALRLGRTYRKVRLPKIHPMCCSFFGCWLCWCICTTKCITWAILGLLVGLIIAFMIEFIYGLYYFILRFILITVYYPPLTFKTANPPH